MPDTVDFASRLRRNRSGSDRARTIGARVSPDEQGELISAANRAGCNVSEWARAVLLREARNSTSDPLFSEIVALRMMLNELLRPVCCGHVLTAEAFDAHLQNIRQTKQKVAQDIRRQYAAAADLES